MPDNSLLDGLFTSGLRFVSNWSGLASGEGRVATARYEMLSLTEEAHKLGPPLSGPGVREFLVPTQLHELFCWVHHLKPLDLIGKPWANYHLEMQFLQVSVMMVALPIQYFISAHSLLLKYMRFKANFNVTYMIYDGFKFQDALKLVRRDRSGLTSSQSNVRVPIPVQPNFKEMGNGVTMI